MIKQDDIFKGDVCYVVTVNLLSLPSFVFFQRVDWMEWVSLFHSFLDTGWYTMVVERMLIDQAVMVNENEPLSQVLHKLRFTLNLTGNSHYYSRTDKQKPKPLFLSHERL